MELQKLRTNFHTIQIQNLQLAQANSQILAVLFIDANTLLFMLIVLLTLSGARLN